MPTRGWQPALEETLGVILFQEQVLKVARDLAGFTPGQGEQLRRALGAKRATEAIAALRDAFLAGAQAQGVPQERPRRYSTQLLAFGGYSFAKSHAAAFAVTGLPVRLAEALPLRRLLHGAAEQPADGLLEPGRADQRMRRPGLPVWPVDVHASAAACTVEEGGIRLGLGYVKGLRADHIARLLAERSERPFTSLADFCRRTRLNRGGVQNLIMAGALDGWGLPRRHLLWELGTLDLRQDGLELNFQPQTVDLPPQSLAEAMLTEQEIMGLSPGDHIMTLYRRQLEAQGIHGSRGLAGCANGGRVRVAGLLVVHQSPPTAKGFHFLTLEDEDGLLNVIVRPQVYGRYQNIIRGARLLLAAGLVQREGGVTNVLAESIAVLATRPGDP